MIVSYVDGNVRRQCACKITTEHPMSSYGMPVIVREGGEVVDYLAWVVGGYRVEDATASERDMMARWLRGLDVCVDAH